MQQTRLLITFLLMYIPLLNAQENIGYGCSEELVSEKKINNLEKHHQRLLDDDDPFYNYNNQCGYFIRTKIHFIRKSNEYNGLITSGNEEEVVGQIIESLNNKFSESNIEFINLNYTYLDDDECK